MVTGSAGFIGSNVANLLLKNEYNVVGLDNLNDYYDVNLKKYRNKKLLENSNYQFHNIDIENIYDLEEIF
jgi:UDP-glucuronate 4-epimerase